jgi:hypothetical protein
VWKSLLDAFTRMRSASPAPLPVLTLAGYDYRGGVYGEEFRRRVEASPLAACVTFAGHVPYGPALFDLYDAHDVLVLAVVHRRVPAGRSRGDGARTAGRRDVGRRRPARPS